MYSIYTRDVGRVLPLFQEKVHNVGLTTSLSLGLWSPAQVTELHPQEL